MYFCYCAVAKVTIVPIEEEYLIVDMGGATYVGELGNGIKPPISIHAARWCVMECPLQWDFVMKILVFLLGLVNNDGRNE